MRSLRSCFGRFLPGSVLVLTACLFTLCPTLALAQAAPPDPPPPAQAAPPDPPPPAREGSVEFALVGTTGNASSQTIGLNGELIARPGEWVVRNKAAFVRNEADNVLAAESIQYLFRLERALTPRASIFSDYEYFRDQFAGIEHRNGVGGGVIYKLVNTETNLLSVDASLGYLNEQRLTGPDVSSGTYGFGGEYRWMFSSTAELSEEVGFTGTFAQADDWRVAQTLAVTARLTTLLSLKVSNSVRYANAPVPGFKNTDTSTGMALVAKF